MPRLEEERDESDRDRVRQWIGYGALGVLALLLAGMAFNSRLSAGHYAKTEAWRYHALMVLLSIGQTHSAANEALRGERGYLLTHDEGSLDAYRSGRDRLRAAVRELGERTRDHPPHRPAVAELDRRATVYLAVLARSVELERSGSHDAAVEIVRQGADRDGIDMLLAALNAIAAEERRRLRARERADDRTEAAVTATDGAFAVLAFALLLLCGLIARDASLARKRARDANRRLRRAASTDELTGLANRRAIVAAMEKEITRSTRSGTPLALALVDIDHFKRVNDTHGHHAGDEVLRALAEVARGTMRSSDQLGRIGGEEFAMLMPETDLAAARIAAERLCKAVAAHPCPGAEGGVISVTLSAGVAVLRPEETRDHWMTRADEALYAAKSGGRNRVNLAA